MAQEVEKWKEYPQTIEGTEQLGGSVARWQYNASKGEATFSLTEEKTKELSMVILAGKASRVYFPKRYKQGEINMPVCRSKDGMTPEGIEDSPALAEYCGACSEAEWGEDGEKPKCQQQYTFFAVEYSEDDAPVVPFLLQFKSSSLKPMNKYINLIKGRKGRPFFAFVTKITFNAEEHEGDVTYFTPSFEIEKELTPAETDHYYHLLADKRGQDVADEEAVEGKIKEVFKDETEETHQGPF